MTPLKFHFLFHPNSYAGELLASALLDRYHEPPATNGLRIPSFLTPVREDGGAPSWDGPDRIRLDDAEHTVVLLLVDEQMTRTVEESAATAWKDFFIEGIQRTSADSSPHRVLGAALGPPGFEFSNGHNMIRVGEPPYKTNGQTDEDYQRQVHDWIDSEINALSLQITIRAIGLLAPQVNPNEAHPPLRLFLSHAKSDLVDRADHPLVALQNAIWRLPIEGWFDARDIPTSTPFEDEIAKGIQDCSIVIAFLTDQYASRHWCQREILDAKRFDAPILVVNALESGEPRNFPYLGNLPTVNAQVGSTEEKAKRIIERAARETLRFRFNRALMTSLADKDETPLASAPEALTLAYKSHQKFLYPDPPLSNLELEILRTLKPDCAFNTPLTRIARSKLRDSAPIVGVSISESESLRAKGLSKAHLKSIVEETHLYLLLAGCRIAYGGALQGVASGDNFTITLFDLVEGYSELAQLTGAEELHPILNYAPWPLHCGYGEPELRLFNKRAELLRGEAPPESEIKTSLDNLFPATNGFRFKATTPEQRLAWTRGLTRMRAQMTRDANARIVIGGKIGRYSGLYPGIVEEAWMSLVAGRPLFLVGALGGAAEEVIDLLLQKEGTKEHLIHRIENADGAEETMRLADDRGLKAIEQWDPAQHGALPPIDGHWITPRAMIESIALIGASGLSKALNNHLTDEQNHQLFQSTDPDEIARLILLGLDSAPTQL